MKRFTAIAILICVLLSGCTGLGERILEPVTFYYLSEDFTFGREGTVFVSEQKEASGHREDLSYLLALYLMGPSEEGHISPIPPGTRIFRLESNGKNISMELSHHARSLSDSRFSLACACLSMTCLELIPAEQITISDGERSISMSRNTLTLFDDSSANAAAEPKEATQ